MAKILPRNSEIIEKLGSNPLSIISKNIIFIVISKTKIVYSFE